MRETNICLHNTTIITLKTNKLCKIIYATHSVNIKLIYRILAILLFYPGFVIADDNDSMKSEMSSQEIVADDLQQKPEQNNRISIDRAQKTLFYLGYSPGVIDGIWGKKSSNAILQYQIDNGLEPTGEIDEVTSRHLLQKEPTISAYESKLKTISTAKQNKIVFSKYNSTGIDPEFEINLRTTLFLADLESARPGFITNNNTYKDFLDRAQFISEVTRDKWHNVFNEILGISLDNFDIVTLLLQIDRIYSSDKSISSNESEKLLKRINAVANVKSKIGFSSKTNPGDFLSLIINDNLFPNEQLDIKAFATNLLQQ